MQTKVGKILITSPLRNYAMLDVSRQNNQPSQIVWVNKVFLWAEAPYIVL